jgi:hypothetical protein
MASRNLLDDSLVRPLLALLRDPEEGVRQEALWALVRLPLSADAWAHIAAYILERLRDPGAEFGIPRHKLIQTAVYVPDWEVRRSVRGLLYEAGEEDRRTAALALVQARDGLAASVALLGLLPGAPVEWREEAALALAGANLENALPEAVAVNDAAATVSFWAAAALAASDDGESWAMERLERGGGIGSWPTLTGLAAYLAGLPPLGGDAQDLERAMVQNQALALAARWLFRDLRPQPQAFTDADVASMLAGLVSSMAEIPAWSIYESTHTVRFWLAMALARAGGTGPLAQMVRIGAGPWSDPIRLQDALENLPPLPTRLRPWLLALEEELDGEDAVGSIAWDILSFAPFASGEAGERLPHLPPAEAAKPAVSESERLEAQALAESKAQDILREAHSTSERLLGAGPGEIGPPPEMPVEELAATPAPLAAELVTALWRLALIAGYGIGLGNEIGRLIMAFSRPFRPDLPALWALYHQTLPERREYGYLTGESLQLAWAISRAGLAEVLSALVPWLENADPETRQDAATLVILVAQYEPVDFAPMFGGGTGPADVSPPEFEEGFPAEGAMRPTNGGGDGEAISGANDDLEGGETMGFDIPTWEEEEPPRVINTGFTPQHQPERRLTPFQPLATGEEYYYWFEEGLPDTRFGIDTEPVARPEVPAEAELTIALFESAGGLQVRAGADVGRMKLGKDGWLRVLSQPMDHDNPLPDQERRLYFPVRVPDAPGEYRLRCNMYLGQMLLQSRLITARAVPAGTEVAEGQRQLRSDLDYTVSNVLDAALLNELEPHRLSLMLNSTGDASHSVYIFGGANGTLIKQSDIRFDEGELEDLVERARRKLRLASWIDLPDGRMLYRYEDGARNLSRMHHDLVEMAKSGYKFYTKFINTLDPDGKERFRELLATTGLIQIAFKRSPRQLLPAALIYDYRLYPAGNTDQYRLCARFEQAFNDGEDLLSTPCFQGQCPEREQVMVVCPSGFWGFRHSLGMPVSLCDLDEDEQLDPAKRCGAPDMPAVVGYADQLRLSVGIATDLALWAEHKLKLKGLKPGLGWSEADDLNEVFEVLQHPPHLLYFYCHGGIDEDGAATLRFGSEQQPARIGSYIFEMLDIRWQDPRPLVFINGCHTTAVSPEQALELVTPLIRRAYAAGVIGTEVTIFEPLATRFAEVCMGHFFSGIPIGESIRLARLALLMEGNPLGLVYIPFVHGGLRLVELA